MNPAAHNPEFSDDCSITGLLSRIATLTSERDNTRKQLIDANKQISDLVGQLEQSTREKTALTQRIAGLERSAALNSSLHVTLRIWAALNLRNMWRDIAGEYARHRTSERG